MTPVYYECDNCGEVIPEARGPHLAEKREWFTTFGDARWTTKTRWLCCICYRHVGGTCDGH